MCAFVNFMCPELFIYIYMYMFLKRCSHIYIWYISVSVYKLMRLTKICGPSCACTYIRICRVHICTFFIFCAYLYISVSICAYMHRYMYLYCVLTRICVLSCTYTYIRICIVHICTYFYTCSCLYVSVPIFAYMHIYIYMCCSMCI